MEKAEKKTPSRELEIKIDSNAYKIEFPNTGQLIQIEAMKARLSEDQYSGIVSSGTHISSYVQVLIDMIATFNVLTPSLRKDLNVQRISDLKAEDSAKLVKVYVKDVLPWLNDWFIILNTDVDKKDE